MTPTTPTATPTPATATLIPVLLYHSITDEPPRDQPAYTVSPARFARHVDAMVASGRTSLTITELAAGLRGERPLPPRAFAVTFDDGFADTPAATALLEERGIAGTVFIATDRIGGERSPIAPATLPALLGQDRVELGAHTVSHPHLDELTPHQARAEILDSRHVLEQHAGRPVHAFAYPHGAHDASVRQAVIGAGYHAAAAVKNAFCHAGDDPMAIARLTIKATTSTATVADLLDGRGAPPAWAGERVRTRAYRSARRARRRVVSRATRRSATRSGHAG
jgi:peptidoglycan/xylan/chitin deacetylase (PgdA/CDA1 family)